MIGKIYAVGATCNFCYAISQPIRIDNAKYMVLTEADYTAHINAKAMSVAEKEGFVVMKNAMDPNGTHVCGNCVVFLTKNMKKTLKIEQKRAKKSLSK